MSSIYLHEDYFNKLMNTPRILKNKNTPYYVVAIVLITLGIVFSFFAIKSSYDDFKSEQESHLQSLAWSTDRSLANFFDNTALALEAVYKSNADGSIESTFAALSKSELIDHSLIDGFLYIEDSSVSHSTIKYSGSFAFPYGYSCSEPCVCMDDNGNEYLAITYHIEGASGNKDIAALLKIKNLFKVFEGKELPDYYWLALYNSKQGYCLVDQNTQQYIIEESPDSAMNRNDWLLTIVQAEKKDVVICDSCDGGNAEGDLSRWLIAAVPRGLSRNGFFSVGIAVPAKHYTGIIFGLAWKGLLSILLIVSGIILFTRMLRISHEANMRYQLLLDASEEISHNQRLETIGTIASKVNHEFSNLLTPIMAYSLMAIECAPEDNEELMDYLENIYDASKEANEQVRQLLQFSRKGNTDDYTLLSPDEVISKVANLLSPTKPENVEIELNLSCPSKCLYVPQAQLEQVFINLIKNAFEAMSATGGTLSISSSTSGATVLIQIADTGCGISQEEQTHIFEPFYTSKDSGTGLGLAIVSSIIDMLHGKVEVNSEPGKGTEFIIQLQAKDLPI